MTDQLIALLVGVLMLSTGFLMKSKKGKRDYVYILFGSILVAIGIYGMYF